MPGRLENYSGRALLHFHAETHHYCSVCNSLHHAEIVADEDEPQTLPVPQPFEKLQNLRADRDIERGDCFIANQKAWPGCERPRYGGALELAARELVRPPVAEGGVKPDVFQQVQRLPTSRSASDPVQAAQGDGSTRWQCFGAD